MHAAVYFSAPNGIARLPLPEEDRNPWECQSPEQARERAAAMLSRFLELVTE